MSSKNGRMNKNFAAFSKLDKSKFYDNYIVIVFGKVVEKGKDIEAMLKRVREKYPNQRPLVAKIPGREALIL